MEIVVYFRSVASVSACGLFNGTSLIRAYGVEALIVYYYCLHGTSIYLSSIYPFICIYRYALYADICRFSLTYIPIYNVLWMYKNIYTSTMIK